MVPVPDEMLEAHAILSQYVAVHDEIFKFSWRKVLPIPGIFKPIDYGRHHSQLTSLSTRLERVLESLRRIPDAPAIFPVYVAALLDTVAYLRDMCQKLYEKSQGDMASYSKEAYRRDVDTYHELVNAYRSLGAQVNRYV
ncbi:MAG: hypothetical protein WBC39_01830 [Phycisphaerae bacterium]